MTRGLAILCLVNGLLRQYFPKGTDLSRWSAEEIEAVVHALNTRPRKTLVGGPRPRHSTSSYSCSNKPVLQRPVESRQYLSIRYTERLSDVGASASVGSVADSYDNAMAEALNGTFKAELIDMQGPWRDVDQVERAIFQWVAWYNEERLHSALEDGFLSR